LWNWNRPLSFIPGPKKENLLHRIFPPQVSTPKTGNSTGMKPMNGNNAFVDTNILVYVYSREDSDKRQKAIDIFNSYDCVISTQVLNEFSNIAIKKLHLSIDDIQHIINEILAACDLAIVGSHTIRHALNIHGDYGFSYYDSLIVSSALECGCDLLLTEDLNDGQKINDMTIKNIFSTREDSNG
jgi:predicted nucleic acid-binding protein